MKLHRTLLSAALCALLAFTPLACGDPETGAPSRSEEEAAAQVSTSISLPVLPVITPPVRPKNISLVDMVSGPDAGKLLSSARQTLLAKLQAASSKPVELVVDRTSKAVMAITLSLPVVGKDGKSRGLSFINDYQALLDDRVSPAELSYHEEPTCDDAVATFDRVVGKLAVVGSKLTIHLDGAGNVVAVTNGVAPVPATIVKIDPTRAPGASDFLAMLRDSELNPGAEKRVKVLVPAYDGSGLHEGELASWPDRTKSGGYTAAVVVGNVALTPKLSASSQGNVVTSGGTPPRFRAESHTKLPEFISYRDLGGVVVSGLPAERNPLESAYRFLEEHPTLLHTGAARCQFSPKSLGEDASAPGVYFARLEQRYGPIPVYGSEIIFQLEGLFRVMSLSGRSLPDIQLPTAPSITEREAIDAQQTTLLAGAAAEPSWAPAVNDAIKASARTRLVVFPRFLQRERTADTLAYEVVRGPFTSYVDAQTKAVLAGQSGLHFSNYVREAFAMNEFSAPFYVNDEIDGIPTGLDSPRSSDNLPTRAGGNTDASLAKVASFYASLGWLGTNGRGSNWIANTNVGISTGCLNAFFDSYLTGSAFFCNGMAATDVVGHELTHGVIASSSALVYLDEAGAINEAYADLMGNLIFPDVGGGWLVGELTSLGAIRDMANPANPAVFSQPSNMSGYVPRNTTCNAWPFSCDFGFVHTNSGIINRAHQLLADGFTRAGVTVKGIGRNKLARLAFVTMTRRLPANARMNDVPVATRDVCEMFVSRGVQDITNTSAFTTADCDAVDSAFFEVGLAAGLSTGWSEQNMGFTGTDVHFPLASDTTPNLCNVTNVTASLATWSGTLMADLDPTTPTPPTVGWGFNTLGITFVMPSPSSFAPIGTPLKTHTVSWWSIYGLSPRYATDVIVGNTCPPLATSSVTSPAFTSGAPFGGSGVTSLGPPTGTIDPKCTLTRTDVELWSNDNSQRLSGPGSTTSNTVRYWFFSIPVDFNQTATLLAPQPGLFSLVDPVSWGFDAGRGINVKLRYTFNHPANVVCTP